jgi:hypothetical protein
MATAPAKTRTMMMIAHGETPPLVAVGKMTGMKVVVVAATVVGVTGWRAFGFGFGFLWGGGVFL